MRLEIVQVLVDGIRRYDLVLNAVETRHQHCRKRKVRVAGVIGAPELEALCLLALRIHWDPDAGAAVALRVNQIDRCFVARNQPAIGIRRWRGECQNRWSVFQQTADVILTGLADSGVAARLVELILFVLPDALMAVHARAIVLKERLGHKTGGLAAAARDQAALSGQWL